MKPIPPETRKHIIEELRRGIRRRELAGRFGIALATVHHIAQRNGIKSDSPCGRNAWKKRRAALDRRNARIVKLLEAGLFVMDVAFAAGVTEQMVRIVAKRAGVKARSAMGRNKLAQPDPSQEEIARAAIRLRGRALASMVEGAKNPWAFCETI